MNNRVGKGSSTRQRIVITATRLFAEAGYEETSIEVVLEQTALSRGALYHHFDSKEKIFEAVLETVEADISASRGIIDPVAALQAGCDAFLRMARDKTVRQIVLIDAPGVLGWQK